MVSAKIVATVQQSSPGVNPMRLTAAALLMATLLSWGAANGQSRRSDLHPLPEPPDPPLMGSAVEVEPHITVRTNNGDIIEEHRVGGRVVMIRVTPARGPAYVLTDPKGDGSFSNRRDSLEFPPGVPMWVLFSF